MKDPKPAKLDEKVILNNLGFDDSFWELDMAFESNEKWALNPRIREAIDIMHLNLRAIEEISILSDEVIRYHHWLTSRLDGCQHLLSIINVNSAIGERVLLIGRKSAAALKKLERLESINLGDEDKFQSAQEKFRLISQQGPQKAREWDRWLEMFSSINSAQRMEFVLDDEPPPLIENLAQEFTLEIEINESDKDGVEDDSDEEDYSD